MNTQGLTPSLGHRCEGLRGPSTPPHGPGHGRDLKSPRISPPNTATGTGAWVTNVDASGALPHHHEAQDVGATTGGQLPHTHDP